MSLSFMITITLSGLYVGANIGANDAANCIGASVGAGLVRYRLGITLVAIFVVLGALLQGHAVVDTVGKGIVGGDLDVWGVLSALIAGGLFVSVATFMKIPVSTSQSVVGGVSGVGLASGLTLNSGKLITIAESWVLCPILSLVTTWVVYLATRWYLRRVKSKATANRVLTWMVLISACYAAYSLGANNLANAIGPILAMDTEAFNLSYLSIAGAFSIGFGALLFGKRVTETVGRSIVPLDLPGAFAVQVSMAFGLHLFSMVGVPVSTSQAIVGALLGIGLVHGIKTVSRRKILEVVVGWVVTPLSAGAVAYLAYKVITLTTSS